MNVGISVRARINSTALGRARNRWASCQSPDYSQLDAARRSHSGGGGGENRDKGPDDSVPIGLMPYEKPKRIPFLSPHLPHSRLFERRSAQRPSWGRRQVTRREPAHTGRTWKTSKLGRAGRHSKFFFDKMLIWIRFQVSTSTQTNTSYTHTHTHGCHEWWFCFPGDHVMYYNRLYSVIVIGH